MKIIITGKNIELTPSLKDFVEKKMDSIRAFVEHLQEIDVTLSVDKTKSQGTLHTAEVTIWAKGINFRASHSHPDMYAAIDLILDKLQKQITKYKDKVKGKKRGKGSRKDANFKHQVFALAHEEEPVDLAAMEVAAEVVEADTREEEPKVIRSNQFYTKPMFVGEAADQLRYLQQEFIVFSNAETGEVNVVYRRNDGNVGLIEPHGA